VALTAFDILFWFMIIMMAVIAYAIDAGFVARHRSVVLGTLFSLVSAVLYIMLIGENGSLGFAGAAPAVQARPKVEKIAESVSVPPAPAALLKSAAVTQPAEISTPTGPFTDCEGCPSMIAIPPGQFNMGSPVTEPGRLDNEGPVAVRITYPFGVGRYEVSRDQFALFVDATGYTTAAGCYVEGRYSRTASWKQPGFEQAGNHPVVCVNHTDARAFVAWLSKKSKKLYRLLSEAEWEYAARGGTSAAYAYGDKFTASAGNLNRQRDGTAPNGYAAPNGFGLHDVHGNAWEIVEDCWHDDLALNDQNGKANTWRADCSQRVIRGGGWDSSILQSRLASRGTMSTQAAANTVGFRIARVFN
jgi:formylglycine-generating enzyme required for sulfatase activity